MATRAALVTLGILSLFLFSGGADGGDAFLPLTEPVAACDDPDGCGGDDGCKPFCKVFELVNLVCKPYC